MEEKERKSVWATYAILHKWSNFNCMYGTQNHKILYHITQLKQNASDKAENIRKRERREEEK